MRLLLLALILSTAGCASTAMPEPFGTDTPLPATTLTAARLDTAVIGSMARQIDAQALDLHSLLILRGGKLAFEAYYNGYTRHTPHDIRSATKSITSLLTGIAIDQGALGSVDEPLMEHLGAGYPDITDKDDLTLRHLLTMSSGLDCHDRDRTTRGQEDRMYRSKDWVRYFLSLNRTYAPADTTLYCTGGVVALGAAIAAATDQDVAAFADAVLFAPLGIENYQWERFDDGRQVDTGGHLWITPQGLAKIGQLVLQEGTWEDRQLISPAWIAESTKQHTTSDGQRYGYLWWRYHIPYGNTTVEVVNATGNGGQNIFIVPAYDLVVVTTAGYYNSDKAGIPHELMFRGILLAIPEIQEAVKQHQRAQASAGAKNQ
ncbi:MAG: serine hydrolase [Bacteroidota bacterium]